MDGVTKHSWRMGTVDPLEEHFRLRYYGHLSTPNPSNKFDVDAPVLARVGKGDGATLVVEFLDEHNLGPKARQAIQSTLDFYIAEHADDDK